MRVRSLDGTTEYVPITDYCESHGGMDGRTCPASCMYDSSVCIGTDCVSLTPDPYTPSIPKCLSLENHVSLTNTFSRRPIKKNRVVYDIFSFSINFSEWLSTGC
jgi:hypothetical protein